MTLSMHIETREQIENEARMYREAREQIELEARMYRFLAAHVLEFNELYGTTQGDIVPALVFKWPFPMSGSLADSIRAAMEADVVPQAKA